MPVYKCSNTWWIHTSKYKDCTCKNESSHVGLQNIHLDIMRTYCVVTQMSKAGRRVVRQACMHVPVYLNIYRSLHMTPQNKIVTRVIWFIMVSYQDRRTPDINHLLAIKYPIKWFYTISSCYCLNTTYDLLICAWFYDPYTEDGGQTTATSLHSFSPPTFPSLDLPLALYQITSDRLTDSRWTSVMTDNGFYQWLAHRKAAVLKIRSCDPDFPPNHDWSFWIFLLFLSKGSRFDWLAFAGKYYSYTIFPTLTPV